MGARRASNFHFSCIASSFFVVIAFGKKKKKRPAPRNRKLKTYASGSKTEPVHHAFSGRQSHFDTSVLAPANRWFREETIIHR